MPSLGFLPGGQFLNLGNLPPQLPLVNMYAEQAATEPSQFVLISRPIMGDTIFGFTPEYGDGPIYALYLADGVLGGDTVALSGVQLFVDGNYKGDVAVDSDISPSIAGNEMGIVVTGGLDAKFYDGTTFRSIAFPDGAYVRKVVEQGGRFVFLRKDSNRYYFTAPLANMLDGSGDIVIDGLDYISAENEPDQLIDAIVYQDNLVLGGSQSIEIHTVTGDNNVPWTPVAGSVIHTGVKATGCMTTWGNTFAWIAPSYAVFAGPGRERISDYGIETTISQNNDVALDAFNYTGLDFLRVLGEQFDTVLHAGQWAIWDSDDAINPAGGFVGGPCYRDISLDVPVFGSKNDGKIYAPGFAGGELTGDFTRTFRFGLPIDGGVVTIHNVLLRCTHGQTDGQTVELRASRDGGEVWTNWDEVSLGDDGETRVKAEWRALGMFDSPGALFECRVTQGALFNVSGAYYNEFVQGRSR